MRHAHAPRVKSRLEWQQGRTAEFESAVHVETLAEPQPPMLCRSFLGSPTASDVADSILRLQISTTCCQFSARKYTERRKFCCCCSWTGDAAKGGDGRTDDSSFIRLRRPWLCNRRRSPSFPSPANSNARWPLCRQAEAGTSHHAPVDEEATASSPMKEDELAPALASIDGASSAARRPQHT